jgi:hypothetical protein
MSIIYGLLDDDDTVRYVGATCLSLELRTKLHWRQRHRSNSPSRRWLQSRDVLPKAIVLEVCKSGYESEIEAEARWIAHYGLENLLNVVAAGYKFEGQYHQVDPVSEAERRRKIRIASTGVCRMTEEGKNRGALKRTGQKRSPEARQKMRDAKRLRRARIEAQGGETPLMCGCGAGPFAGPHGLGSHVGHKHAGQYVEVGDVNAVS